MKKPMQEYPAACLAGRRRYFPVSVAAAIHVADARKSSHRTLSDKVLSR